MTKVGAQGRRRGFASWFVEPYKQVRLGLIFLLVNSAFAVLILSVFGYYVWDMYMSIATYFQLAGGESATALSKFSVPLIVGASLILFFVIATILVSVRYTHEIYGPLVSIHRFLDDMLAGRSPAPIQLRDSDQLQDLASKLNLLAERLATDQRAGTLVAIHRYLDEALAGRMPGTIKLRDGDSFSDLAEKIVKIVEK
jgi:hypothetical protein